MRRILIATLSFHWLAVFFLLAGLATISAADGIPAAFRVLGMSPPQSRFAMSPGIVIQGLFALGFAMVAGLFLWTLITAIFDDSAFPGDTDDIARIAFSAAVIMCTALVFASVAVGGGAWLSQSIAVQFGALLCSYLVIHVDRRAEVRRAAVKKSDIRAAATRMALGAAHDSLLPRLQGRTPPAASAKKPEPALGMHDA